MIPFFIIDDRIAVSATSIPMHLEQMIEILEQEEQENGATVWIRMFPCSLWFILCACKQLATFKGKEFNAIASI